MSGDILRQEAEQESLRSQITIEVVRKHKVKPTLDPNVSVDLDSFLELRDALIDALCKARSQRNAGMRRCLPYLTHLEDCNAWHGLNDKTCTCGKAAIESEWEKEGSHESSASDSKY